MVLTTQNPPANNLHVLTAMEITQLTLGCAAWKREKEIWKIKYNHDIPFPKARKIVEITLPARSYSSNTSHTKPFLPRMP